MIYVTIGILTGCLLLWSGGYFTGRGLRQDRHAALADLQAAIDRCAREEWEPVTAPFPELPDGYVALSDVSAGWDRVEAQQRGW